MARVSFGGEVSHVSAFILECISMVVVGAFLELTEYRFLCLMKRHRVGTGHLILKNFFEIASSDMPREHNVCHGIFSSDHIK